MRIAEFEKAFRAVLGADLMLPALAAPGLSSQFSTGLPAEFKDAMDSLASRSAGQPEEDSLLRNAAAQWS